MRPAIRIWTLDELVLENKVKLGRGNIISKKDIAQHPGDYPIYSSAREKNGTFGYYGKYMFDEELITWSIDGGGRLFYRPRHKFSVTNVGGTLRILDTDFLDCRYLHLVLTHLHSKIRFDWVYKAHPSVIRQVYNEIPLPSLEKQREIVEKLDQAFVEIEIIRVQIKKQSNSHLMLREGLIDQLLNGNSDDFLIKKLKGVTSKIGSGATPRGGEESYKLEGISLIRSLNVYDDGFRVRKLARIDDVQAQALSNVEVQTGDILLNITGASIARTCIAPEDYLPARVNQHVSIIRPKSEIILSEYLHYLLRSQNMKNKLLGVGNEGGSTRQALTKVDIENTVIRFPSSIEHQIQIIEELDSINELSGALLNNLLKMEFLYTNLLSSLLASTFKEAVA